jgi:Domain of Unknown Function (DUF1080)
MNRRIWGVALLVLGSVAPACARGDEKDRSRESEGGWVALFNGRDLEGWEAYDRQGKQSDLSTNWVVRDGVIRGTGEVSHLFSPRGDYKNFRYRAELKINDGGNSGMYVRTAKGPGFPKGYEVQVNSTHRDPVRTGSLYNMVLIKRQLVPPDTWFTQEVEARGNHLTITVNGQTLYEFVDANNTFTEGYFAFQQHNLGSEVQIRKVEVIELP